MVRSAVDCFMSTDLLILQMRQIFIGQKSLAHLYNFSHYRKEKVLTGFNKK